MFKSFEKLDKQEKAEKLLNKNLKEKMKMAMVVGMATMAMGGIHSMDAKKAYGGEIDKSKLERVMDKHPDDLSQEEFKYLIEQREQEQMESAKERAEKIREELIQFFASQEFFKKLKVEYDGNEKEAREIQMTDINNLKTVEVIVLRSNDYKNEVKNIRMNTPSRSSMGCYNPVSHRLLINANASGFESEVDDVIRHELTHAATKNKVSKKAAKILKESYKELQDGKDLYNMSPEERLARKQGLEHDLVERLKIKKYEEKFTKEHYNEMMKAYNSNTIILLPSSLDFIKRTKPSFENFKKIFDEIAQNENQDKKTIV